MKIGDDVVYVEAVTAATGVENARRHRAWVTNILDDSDYPVVNLAYLSPHDADVGHHGRLTLTAVSVPYCANEATIKLESRGKLEQYPHHYVRLA